MIPAPFLFLADWADTSPGTFIPVGVAVTILCLAAATFLARSIR
jgi:hypothetical protein